MKNTRRRRRGQASNVFCDLGFGPGESASLTLRSDLMIALSSLIRRRRLTTAGAAAVCGVSKSRVEDVMRGSIERLSAECLVAMLATAGVEVRLVVEPMPIPC